MLYAINGDLAPIKIIFNMISKREVKYFDCLSSVHTTAYYAA